MAKSPVVKNSAATTRFSMERKAVPPMETKKPEYLIVNLGTNGVSFMDEEYFKSEYTEMVEALKEACPETKIMLSSLYPVALSYPYQDDINNDKLAAASEWIYEIAEEEGVRYIDLAAAVKDENGDLPETSHIGDGYHLSKDAWRTCSCISARTPISEGVKNEAYHCRGPARRAAALRLRRSAG